MKELQTLPNVGFRPSEESVSVVISSNKELTGKKGMELSHEMNL